MKILHIANVHFESELKDDYSSSLTISQALEQHDLFMQLQFLPLIYADSSDGIVVTNFCEDDHLKLESQQELFRHGENFPKILKFDSSEMMDCESLVTWGYSRQVAQWTRGHGIDYHTPSWESVKTVNSKIFSFENNPKLSGAQLIRNVDELEEWLKKTKRPCVLKNAYGVSGGGNLIITDMSSESAKRGLDNFCLKEWQHNRPVIGEPWMERVLDFSTQWKIHSDGFIQYFGACRIQNSQRGTYQSTLFGNEEELFSDFKPFLKEHKDKAQEALQLVFKTGYHGYAGIDAMVYKEGEHDLLKLQPIVEINARQTMSLAALFFQNKWFPEKIVLFRYSKPEEGVSGLLPTRLRKKNGALVVFTKQLYFSVL